MVRNGELQLDRIDILIPGRGDVHFTLHRRYSSELEYSGPLGFGWDFTYNERLLLQPEGDVVWADGLGHTDTWRLMPEGSYETPKGNFDTLSGRPDSTFVLRSPNGFKRFFQVDGKLERYEDRHGNRMLFQYDMRGNLHRVIDAYGREIDFYFEAGSDGVDRLVKIRDFLNREVAYSYNGDGDLVEVRTLTWQGTPTTNAFLEERTEVYRYPKGLDLPRRIEASTTTPW